ncbi:alpha/beta hydrolase [Rhizobiaceae bacterium]|nr:alpha/beta hydrolase [Rhizobiaceae bacterium]
MAYTKSTGTAAGETIDTSNGPLKAVSPPSRRLLFSEVRALPELYGFLAALPTLAATAPRGDGQPVLVLPGLATTDNSTWALRRFLAFLGYPTYGWEQGRNYGPLPGVEEKLKASVRRLADEHGRKVSIVGWSLGGIYARQLGKALPDEIRQVISMGSPFNGDPRATNAWKLYQFTSGHDVDTKDRHMGGEISPPPPVPTTSIYSRTDGICAWQTCLETPATNRENIEVRGSHCGLGHNAAAVYAVADRLALPEGGWTPFQRTGLKKLAFPRPRADDVMGVVPGVAAAA